jgi:hypothetical protein
LSRPYNTLWSYRYATRRSKLFIGGWAVVFVIVLCLAASERVASTPLLAPAPFTYVEIDAGVAGDCKMVGDIDGDGQPDLVIGGLPGEGLNWYRYPTWAKSVIAIPGNEFTTDGALGDVDGDGDLDIVIPDGNGSDNLLWFQNPRPADDPTNGALWTRYIIGSVNDWAKDVELADYDANGLLDVATRRADQAIIFFQTSANSWLQVDLDVVNLGEEGMASGDIDKDGDMDLVVQGAWLRNPGGAAARTGANWSEFPIGQAHQAFKALVVDLNQDGTPDVLFSSSEGAADVNWWTPQTGDPTGLWVSHLIVPNLERAHTLQAADIDKDGDIDVVLGQMHTSESKEIFVMYNTDGQALSWQKQLVDNTGLHNGVVADIGNDGDYDIFGANWAGNPPVKLWVNQLNPASPVLPLDRWTYKEVTANHLQTFGLAFGDMDGDGRRDIASGQYWYRNPGGDLLGEWAQSPFPTGMHAILTLDVDGDNLADLIAQKDEGDLALYWLEATDSTAAQWNAINIGALPAASHALGAQGYRMAQVEAGGKPEVLITSGAGIYYFRIPADPATGDWPQIHVSPNPSDEGFAVGDIDRDQQLDVAATTGDSKRVEWYRNPGDGSANWATFHIGDFAEATYPDRTELADLNKDGRLDIIVSEENGENSDAQTDWWEQPLDPTQGNWTRRLIVSQATTNSMDVADMDQNDATDIILAEHRGDKKLSIWANDGQGGLTEQIVSTGRESHLGARTVDLDGDGDLDIVSIAWDEPQFVHLWRNDAIDGSTQPTATPTNTTVGQPTATPTGTTTLDVTPATPQPSATATPTVTLAPTTAPTATRVSAGLQVLYDFKENGGSTIHDRSGAGAPLDLTLAGSAVSAQPTDAIRWLEGGGLAIDASVLLASTGPATKLIEASRATNEITLEAWIKPASAEQTGPVRILTLSADPFLRNFTLGQEFGLYEVRLRTTATSENGMPALSSPDGMAQTDLTHVVYTRNSGGLAKFYLNGVEVASATISGDLSTWDPSFRLALANELTVDRPWLGEFHLVAIYNRALSSQEVMQNFQVRPGGGDASRLYLPTILRSLGALLLPNRDETRVSATGEQMGRTGRVAWERLFSQVALGVVIGVALLLSGVFLHLNHR